LSFGNQKIAPPAIYFKGIFQLNWTVWHFPVKFMA